MAFYKNSEGLNIFYETLGDPQNDAIMFLDGWGSPHQMNTAAAEALKDSFYCILMDYRGYGTSDPSPKHNAMSWCALDIKELIEHLHMEKKGVTLMGMSMGISVILGYFKKYAGLYINRLIMCDQSPYVTSDKDWKHGRLQGEQDKDMILWELQQLFEDPDQFLKDELWVRMNPTYYKNCTYPQEIYDSYKTMMEITMKQNSGGVDENNVPVFNCDPLAKIATWFDSGIQDYRPVVPTIKVPSLVFAPYPGTEYDFACSEFYRDNLGGPVDFVVLEPGTHMALSEHFPYCMQKIRAFMQRSY